MDIHVDLLTGLPDRRFFWQLVDEKLAEHSEGACMLTMNIEHFSYYNKWYGRQEGDKLLAEIAAFLQQCCRDWGVVAGYMGDDVFFCFLLFVSGRCGGEGAPGNHRYYADSAG